MRSLSVECVLCGCLSHRRLTTQLTSIPSSSVHPHSARPSFAPRLVSFIRCALALDDSIHYCASVRATPAPRRLGTGCPWRLRNTRGRGGPSFSAPGTARPRRGSWGHDLGGDGMIGWYVTQHVVQGRRKQGELTR
ncbi:hypothetical protein ANCDUO_11448 [Ancylostoma duodenale]|uniref:Uncharacterized protein n=1 Tax=Ancylostoma duodenale TaxID=51022 RepID=A0A0C2GN05_9BILA|nr:hypothetical protein ANCDUO_11448 [Ancylostoma duodenale]